MPTLPIQFFNASLQATLSLMCGGGVQASFSSDPRAYILMDNSLISRETCPDPNPNAAVQDGGSCGPSSRFGLNFQGRLSPDNLPTKTLQPTKKIAVGSHKAIGTGTGTRLSPSDCWRWAHSRISRQPPVPRGRAARGCRGRATEVNQPFPFFCRPPSSTQFHAGTPPSSDIN